DLVEDDETIMLSLTADDPNIMGSPTTAVLTIIDDDSARLNLSLNKNQGKFITNPGVVPRISPIFQSNYVNEKITESKESTNTLAQVHMILINYEDIDPLTNYMVIEANNEIDFIKRITRSTSKRTVNKFDHNFSS